MNILHGLSVGFKHIGRGLAALGRGTIALVGICGVVAALANYTMTQGSGTTFASVVISTVHYAASVICDATVGGTQCAAVDSSGNVSVKDAAVLAAVQAAVPAGTNLIGKVGIDQTTAGTTNGVQDAATAATGATAPTKSIEAGGIAQNAEATAVTNGQLKALVTDLVGKLIILPFANPENALNGEVTSAITGTSDTAVTGMGAQGAGIRNYVTSCTYSNSHATQGTIMVLKDGAAGTIIAQAPAAPAFNGATITYNPPIKTTANTALNVANITTGSSTLLSCTGYKGI